MHTISKNVLENKVIILLGVQVLSSIEGDAIQQLPPVLCLKANDNLIN